MKSAYTYSNEEKSAWLRGFFDGEGWVGKFSHTRAIAVGNTDENLIQIARKYLLDLAIPTHHYTARKMKLGRKDLYSLYIWGQENILKFEQRVGFNHKEKADKLNLLVNGYVNGKPLFEKFTQETLRDCYLEKKMTCKACADYFHLGISSIKRWLKKWNIATRTRREWSNKVVFGR